MTNKESQKKSAQKLKPGIKLAKEARDRAIQGAQHLINQLPKAVEKSPLLQNTLTMIVEMQQQAKSIRKDANEEVHKLLEVLHHSYGDLETKARSAGDKAKKQAKDGLGQLLEKWEEKKGSLPKKFTGEMDNLLSRVGLVMKPAAKSKATAKPATAKKAAPAKKAPAKKTAAAKAKPSAPKKTPIKKVVQKSPA